MIRRVIAAVLVLLLTFTLPACAKTTYNIVSPTSGKLTAYVRVFVPYLSTDSDWIGHYDVMVEGEIELGGRTFVNPCFSYGTDSRLYIFSESQSKHIYSGENYKQSMVFYWKFTLPNANKLNNLLSSLASSVASVDSITGGIRCRLRSDNPFSSYSKTRVNCFAAVAVWMRLLGNNKLWSIYKKAYSGGMSYAPRSILKAYSSNMTQRW